MFFFFPFGFGLFGTLILLFFLVKLGIYIFRDIFDGELFPPDWRHRPDRWFSFRGFRPTRYRIKKPKDAEHQIFRLASKLQGRLTISDIVINTGLGIKEAEEVMNKLVDGVRVRMEIDDNGIVIYEFPEIIARYNNGRGMS